MERLKKRQKSPRNLYGRGESETKLKGSLIIMNGFLHFLRCIIHSIPYKAVGRSEDSGGMREKVIQGLLKEKTFPLLTSDAGYFVPSF